MPKYLVRVTRDSDEDWADVVVAAPDPATAKFIAVEEVLGKPYRYFDSPPPPRYYVADRDEPEDVTGTDYDGN